MPLLTNIFKQASSIKVKSVTDSLFKYGLLFCVLGVVCAIFKTENWVIISLLSIGVLLVMIGIVFYWYFACTKPDYLRSETFQIQKQQIEMLGDKDNQYNPNVEKIINISSPHSSQLDN